MHNLFGTELGILFIPVFFGLGLLLFVFWIWMLIDAIQNPRLSGTEKVVWVLVVIFLHFLGALIYFFAGRSRT
jgi:hypothetical protein